MKKLLFVFIILSFSSLSEAQVQFDHVWTGAVESKLHDILATGLAGEDGSNGQAVINQMNSIGGIFSGGEFQPHHNGPTGLPTYGFGWFYVSYMYNHGNFYQIVKFGPAPPGNSVITPPPQPSTVPQLDLSNVAKYDQAERIFANLTNQINAVDARIDAIDIKFTEFENNPPWLKKLITNPIFAPVMTALGMFVTCKTTGKC
jgi:hypothetical protein